MSKKEDWVEAVVSRARQDNLAVATAKFCLGCEQYEVLITKPVIIKAKAKVQGKDYNGFVVFLCSECCTTADAKVLLDKVLWFSKTQTVHLLIP